MNNIDIVINEVGLRDGLQNQPTFVATTDKLRLVAALSEAGISQFEIASFVSPKAVPQMADAGELFDALLPPAKKPNYTALVPNMKGYQQARARGVNSIAVVLAATDTFNRKNIGRSLDETVVQCQQIILQACDEGVAARAYISTACACPYEGPVSTDEVLRLSEQMIEAGATELSIADTTGAGNPQQIKDLLKPLLQEYSAQRINLHLHDTRGQALAMAWAALELGVFKFDSSIAGLGGCPLSPGASGNLATEDLVFMLRECGLNTGIDFDRLRDCVVLVRQLLGEQYGGRINGWLESHVQ